MRTTKRYEQMVTEVFRAFQSDEQVAEVLRQEAVRLNLALNDFLWPTVSEKLLRRRASPVLAAAYRYFERNELKLP